MKYTPLAQEERYQIFALMKAGRDQTEERRQAKAQTRLPCRLWRQVERLLHED